MSAADLLPPDDADPAAIRATVLRLLRDGEAHPHLIVLAVARVAGELGASAALAADEDVEAMLSDLGRALN